MKFKWQIGGRSTDLQSSPSPGQGGVSINKQLRKAGVFKGQDYHNLNAWVRLLGRANEYEIKTDGKIDTALIDSGAMISMMSREYCEEHKYEIQPLDGLAPIEGSGGRHPLFELCVGQNADSRDQLL